MIYRILLATRNCRALRACRGSYSYLKRVGARERRERGERHLACNLWCTLGHVPRGFWGSRNIRSPPSGGGYIHISLSLYICIYIYICICTYVYIYTYVYTYMHTYIYIYIHTYIYIWDPCSLAHKNPLPPRTLQQDHA
jgi:hypothetical protein